MNKPGTRTKKRQIKTRSLPKMYGEEYKLQCSIVQYLKYVLGNKFVWTSFPAGGGGRVRGAMLKKSGLVAGWPDLQIIKDGIYHGIEVKTDKGKVSDVQKDMHKNIIKSGGKVAICRSINEVEQTLYDWTFFAK